MAIALRQPRVGHRGDVSGVEDLLGRGARARVQEEIGVAPGARLLAGHRERIFANAPFRADNRVRSRARLRAVLDAEYGRVRMWRNERRINGRPSDARGLPRIIAALDEHGTCR